MNKRLRWLMIALAFAATVINYLDRQTLSVAAPVLRDEFHMNNVAYSRVVSAFLLAYTISNGFSGPLIDRLGTRFGYALCIAWWSLAAILHSFTAGPVSLAVYRFLLGIGEAGNWPAAVKVVAEWFPKRERALASGIFNSGSSVGALLAPPVVVYIIAHQGWRTAFSAVGAAGLVWLAVWLPVYRTPPGAADATERLPFQAILRSRFVWQFLLAKIFFDPVWYFYIFWFPEYLKRARNFDMAAIGQYAWIPFAVAGIGNLLGGALSSVLFRCGWSVTMARKCSITAFVLLMLLAIPAVLTSDIRVSFACVALAMMGYTGAQANVLCLPADVFPSGSTGTVFGFASMGSGFGGMVFTLITGWVVDNYSFVPVFFGFAAVPMVFLAILWSGMNLTVPEIAASSAVRTGSA